MRKLWIREQKWFVPGCILDGCWCLSQGSKNTDPLAPEVLSVLLSPTWGLDMAFDGVRVAWVSIRLPIRLLRLSFEVPTLGYRSHLSTLLSHLWIETMVISIYTHISMNMNMYRYAYMYLCTHIQCRPTQHTHIKYTGVWDIYLSFLSLRKYIFPWILMCEILIYRNIYPKFNICF